MGSHINTRQNASATLITCSSYLPDVVILAYSLKRHGSRYPLVVLFTPNLAKDALMTLELEAPKCNIILSQCDHLLPPHGTNHQLVVEIFRGTWTKVCPVQLFEDDAVCFLDANMVVFGDMDSVLKMKPHLSPDWLAASHICVCKLDSDLRTPQDWRPENCAYTPVGHPKALTSQLSNT